jgi:hypothetical protein
MTSYYRSVSQDAIIPSIWRNLLKVLSMQGEICLNKAGGLLALEVIYHYLRPSTWSLSMCRFKFYKEGHAIAQVVSRWLPTAMTWVCVRAEHVGFVVDKVALGQVFS